MVEYLTKEKGWSYASVSEFLAREARERGLEADRDARRNIGNEYRAKGPTALMEAVFASADPLAVKLIIEPQYTLSEVRYIQEKGGKVLAVDAPLHTRYERIKMRGSAKDNVTFAEFARAQEHELASDDPNKNNLAAAINAADATLMNKGTLEDFHREIDRVLASLGM